MASTLYLKPAELYQSSIKKLHCNSVYFLSSQLFQLKELRRRGGEGPFSIVSVGALNPVSKVATRKAQDKNRRVVIVLVP
jgi:hypothetical protein